MHYPKVTLSPIYAFPTKSFWFVIHVITRESGGDAEKNKKICDLGGFLVYRMRKRKDALGLSLRFGRGRFLKL